MQKKIFAIAAAIALVAAGMIWYAFSRTGIAGKVYAAQADAPTAVKLIANARVEIWQTDTLVVTAHANAEGEFAIRLAPGVYEVRVDADGFLAAVFSNQKVERFKRIELTVGLQHPIGRGSSSVAAQTVDSTSVIGRRGRDDVWRAWKNTLTGTPHRMTGSAIALPQAPQSQEQAAKSAQQFLNKFVEDNKQNNPALAKIDLSTLHAEPVRRFKDKWFVTFSQQIKNPVADEMLPVFGSEASVTISGRDVIQFGLDIFPKIKVSAPGPPLGKLEALAKFSQHAAVDKADTANMQMVVFPALKPADTTKFEYVLAYRINVVSRSTNPDRPFEVWSYVVDAATGRTLFRENRGVVQFQASGRVKATIYDKSPEESRAATAPLEGGQIGNDAFDFRNLESGGQFNFPQAAGVRELAVLPSNAHFTLFDSGVFDLFLMAWFGAIPAGQIYQKSLADADVNIVPLGGGSEVTLGLDARPNTFYHLNRIREFFIDHGIGAWLDTPLKVGFVQGFPNAFYSDATEQLVFGNVAEPLGLRSDVIYHEYTHGVVNWLVNRQSVPGPLPLPYKDEPGAINEALADYFACALNGDAEVRIVPPGHSAAQYNRDLNNYLNYNKDFAVGEKDNGYVHDNSRIFSGMLWKLRRGLMRKLGQEKGGNYADALVLEALLLRPVPETFADFSVNLLLADDNDNRLFTGTPNYWEIKQAFEKHGIAIPAFEFNRPTIQNFTLTTSPPSKPTHLEEGRAVRVSAVMHESGYGLDPASVVLELNSGQADLGQALVLQNQDKMARLRYQVNEGNPVRSRQFGAMITARLAVKDAAGNEAHAEVSKPLRDTIKPTYELIGCNRNQDEIDLTIRITDAGSGVDPSRIVARVDGKNVSGLKKEKLNDQEYVLRLKYPYDNQTHTVYAEIADRAGNVASGTQEVSGVCMAPCAFSGGAICLAMALMHYRRRRDEES